MLIHTIVPYLQFLIVHNLFYASMVACLCCGQTVLELRYLSTIFLKVYSEVSAGKIKEISLLRGILSL